MNIAPLLFLDVDGVLNCTPTPTFNQLMESQDWRDTIATTMFRDYRIWYRESIVKRLNNLHDTGLSEIVWLTTWDVDAQSEIAPKLGLSNFRVAQRQEGDHMPSLAWWKLATLKHELNSDQRFVWIDDQLNNDLKGHMAEFATMRGLLVQTESNPGLTHEELDLVEEWLTMKGMEA